MKEYGEALIASIVALLILTVFSCVCISGKAGVAAGLGGVLADSTVKQLTDMEDTVAFSEYQSLGGADFCIRAEEPICAGEKVFISQYLLVQDKEGNDIGYGIKSIRDSNGAEIAVSREDKGDAVCFDKPGVYRIYIETQDVSVKRQEAVLAFPVQMV